jgi:hypothetical protein
MSQWPDACPPSPSAASLTEAKREAPELPLRIKYYGTYERPNAEGATWGPIAAALRIAESKQAEQAQELASDPPGITPGATGEDGGCSGMNACSASFNPHHHGGVVAYHEEGNGYAGCSVWASYGSEDGTSGISGEIEIYGHWSCQQVVPKFEMQIALLIFYEGKWTEIGAPYTANYFYAKDDEGKENSEDFSCGPEHADYDAWIFGRQYDGSFHAQWWGWGREAEVRSSCHGGVSGP